MSRGARHIALHSSGRAKADLWVGLFGSHRLDVRLGQRQHEAVGFHLPDLVGGYAIALPAQPEKRFRIDVERP